MRNSLSGYSRYHHGHDHLWLALASLLEPGDNTIVEPPAYQALQQIPAQRHARVLRFERKTACGLAIDLDALRRAITPRVKAVIVSAPQTPVGISPLHQGTVPCWYLGAVYAGQGMRPVGRSNSPTFGHFKLPHPEGGVTVQ